jgi:hypothetical protein
MTGTPCPVRESWRPVSFRNGFDQPAVGWGQTPLLRMPLPVEPNLEGD